MAVAVSTPAARPRPRPTSAARPRIRASFVIGGALLAVMSAGAFSMIAFGAEQRVQALAVARPVAAGQALVVEDLRVVRVVPDAGVDVVQAANAGEYVGRTAAVPLMPGTLLTEAQLGPATWPDASQAITAVAVEAGRLPDGVAPGSRVLIVAVSAQPSSDGATAGAHDGSTVAATVTAISTGSDASGTAVVTLLTAKADAVRLAAASGDLAIVIVRE